MDGGSSVASSGRRRASRGRRRRGRRAAGPAARHHPAASRSGPGGRRRARTGRSRLRAVAAASSSATVRWSSASASSKLRASIAGSVVVATIVLIVGFGQSVEARGEEHTKPDGHDDARRTTAHPGPMNTSLAQAPRVDRRRDLAVGHPHSQPRPGRSVGRIAHDPAVRARRRSRSPGRAWPAGRARATRRRHCRATLGPAPPAARPERPSMRRIARAGRSVRRQPAGQDRAKPRAEPAGGLPFDDEARSLTATWLDRPAGRPARGPSASWAPGQAVERSPLGGHLARRPSGPARRRRGVQAATRCPDPGDRLKAIRDHDLRRGRRRRRPDVGREIGQRDVRLVAHPQTSGTVCATTARTTASSLNAHRSSSEPPPRARIVTAGASSGRPAAIRSAA